MAQIREIKRRHDEGETIQSIGADFYHRNETTANNKPWIKRYTKGVSRTRGHLNVQRLYRVLHWYKTAPPKAKTWARPQPQAAQTQTLLRPHPLPHDPSPPLWTVHHGSPPCTWGQCLKPLKRDRAP
jgi:hypothetical protein